MTKTFYYHMKEELFAKYKGIIKVVTIVIEEDSSRIISAMGVTMEGIGQKIRWMEIR